MATKKLSEINKVTSINTGDYIIMNAADGNQVQIKKSDFAKAIAEVLPTMPSNQLVSYKVTDMNLVTENSGIVFSSYNSSTLNIPSSGGIFIHIQRLTGNILSSSQYITQYAISSLKHYRRKGNGDGEKIVWKDWEEIYERSGQ